jgi:transposase
VSLQPMSIPPVPADTARLAKVVFKKGNLYMTIGDQIGYLFADIDFADLYAADGSPAISPARLALVTIFQFMEHVTDREAAELVRARIDWKYALRLPLDDTGFDFSVLSDFRERLVAHGAGPQLFGRVLERLMSFGLLRKGGKQRTDATHVLGAVRDLSRLELVAETMRLALEALAAYRPDWLRSIAQPHWYERYQRMLTGFRLPRSAEKQAALAFEIGADGFYLLEAVERADTPSLAASLPEVETLRQVWAQEFERKDGKIRWRPSKARSPATQQVATPHDTEARFATHRHLAWIGYQVHLTETCNPDAPHLITHVETRPAPTAEVAVLNDIHRSLAEADLLPVDHLVDGGYMAAYTIIESQTQYGVHLIGPITQDTSWQAHLPQGITADQFHINWEHHQAICPEGQVSNYWSARLNRYRRPIVDIRFPKERCDACHARSRCTQAKNTGRTLKVGRYLDVILANRQAQSTDAFKTQYAQRAGIEGTLSAAVRKQGARRSRHIGHAKTHLQELLIATAINLKRSALWLMGYRSTGTRPASLTCLVPV